MTTQKIIETDAIATIKPHAGICTDGIASIDQALHQRFLAAATSDNTRRTYRAAIRHFHAWGGLLPCDESSIVRYLLTYAASLNPRTLSLRLTALSQWHRFQGFPDPTSTPTVRKTLTGIERTHGKPRDKARALQIADLERIVVWLADQGDLAALRDSALLQVGFFGAFRRNELVSVALRDVSWEAEGLQVTLPRSKTDQEGQGIVKAIPLGEGVCCPATALRKWIAAAEISHGPLFRAITRWNQIQAESLAPASVNAILSKRAAQAGIEYALDLTSHSLRRGLATSAHRAGAAFQDIKRQGGWKHDGTVQGYIEEAGRFADNAAGTLLRRR